MRALALDLGNRPRSLAAAPLADALGSIAQGAQVAISNEGSDAIGLAIEELRCSLPARIHLSSPAGFLASRRRVGLRLPGLGVESTGRLEVTFASQEIPTVSQEIPTSRGSTLERSQRSRKTGEGAPSERRHPT